MTGAVLRVVRGQPSEEELAALAALMSATETGRSRPASPPLRGRWNDPSRAFHRPLHPGPGAWRAAAWPT